MDPDITMTTAFDVSVDPAERHQAAIDLLTWLYGGGFMPRHWIGTRDDLITGLRAIRDHHRINDSPNPIPFDPRPNR